MNTYIVGGAFVLGAALGFSLSMLIREPHPREGVDIAATELCDRERAKGYGQMDAVESRLPRGVKDWSLTAICSEKP